MGLRDLFRPKWRRSDSAVRLAAVESLEDADALATVAVDDPEESIRRAAVVRLEDRGLLARVAVADESARVRGAALDRLDDPDLVATRAREDPDESVRVQAILRVSEQAALRRAALEDPSAKVRAAAIARVTRQDTLVQVAREDAAEAVRAEAITSVRRQEPLADAALTDSSGWVRALAVGRLSSQEVLARVAREDGSGIVRGKALQRLTDPPLLAQALAAQPEERVRAEGAVRLADPDLVVPVFRSVRDEKLRAEMLDQWRSRHGESAPADHPGLNELVADGVRAEASALVAQLVQASGGRLLGGAAGGRYDALRERLWSLPPAAAPELARRLALQRVDGVIREEIAVALGRIGGPEAVAALTRATLDKSFGVVRMAIRGLGAAGGEDARKAPVALSDDPRKGYECDVASLAREVLADLRREEAGVAPPPSPLAQTLDAISRPACGCGSSDVSAVVAHRTRQDGVDYVVSSYTCRQCGREWSTVSE